ncbi:MAG: glycosyltransferase family 4 protein [Vulcanococcus sp.]|jgi:glycosyltransferase involved in cell wall biosynthesis|uniref:glycosyltransferase family 4 protein n=1 Tax=Vulcanococcus sp. TaxID=2856995 RepID=UPI0025EC1727|nr:glycosyltransferase family 1 protein [Vulcanococcus sp.]MBW0180950.1 glycosyltransferase family 4 protein [Vulcanococcus sp.]
MSAAPLLINLLPYRPELTGLSRYVQRLLAAWPERPLPMQLRLSSAGPAEVSRSPDLPSEQHSTWMRRLQAQALVQHAVPVRRLLRDQLPERIYSPYTDWLWALPQLPQVITCHDLTPLYLPNSRRAHWRSRLWLPQHMQRACLVVAISRSVADQLIATGLPAQRITVVLNGVEPVAQPISVPAGGDCVVLARHARNKNLALALDGFARLLALSPSWPGQLVVVGTRDRCTPALFRQQRELGLEGRVRWIERLNESQLQELLRSALCLISPSLMEGFDYPLLEAQALGLPTLASRIPVHEELHHEAALLFELQDYGHTMANQLLRLSREPALWRQLSQAGLRNALAHTSQRQARELHQLLQGPLP